MNEWKTFFFLTISIWSFQTRFAVRILFLSISLNLRDYVFWINVTTHTSIHTHTNSLRPFTNCSTWSSFLSQLHNTSILASILAYLLCLIRQWLPNISTNRIAKHHCKYHHQYLYSWWHNNTYHRFIFVLKKYFLKNIFFYLLQINFFLYFRNFDMLIWKIIFKNKKNIILIHFRIKNTL